MLVNARHAKNLPGRKTDVSDAQWLAELGAHGLVRASFVPPEPIRELRDLTRARATFARERTREIQRLEKLLEDAGLKLSSVATQITGVSSRAMLSALIAGERDPAVLADLAKGRLRNKIGPLTEALQGRFSNRHAFMTREYLQRTRCRLLQPQQSRPRSSQGRRTAPPARLQSRTDNRQLTGGQASRAAQPRAPAATRTPTAAVNQVIFASVTGRLISCCCRAGRTCNDHGTRHAIGPPGLSSTRSNAPTDATPLACVRDLAPRRPRSTTDSPTQAR